jgi:hypothetical protein
LNKFPANTLPTITGQCDDTYFVSNNNWLTAPSTSDGLDDPPATLTSN